ncbi:NAD-dependent epimerase/dehydratase family protein [Nonomuraea aridisoli]|uniref:NAD-dependent epimerase/dehydratase family protein n=1 Tax=Nonomuraea aridisoli TaxID=2070368 RepID=UPI0011B94671|nr:NAD-dependent epimerase/dehydratase family protein [Nonomuraea aridisoli]
MRVLILGGTWFLGRRIAERLAERGDQVLIAHRGSARSDPGVPGAHLRTDRHDLARHAGQIEDFAPQAVIDTFALTGADVDAVLPVLPHVPSVVLSSQDVYEAYTGLQTGQCLSPVPISEESPLRRERYPYRGKGYPGVPDDYEKLDVEARWLERGAVVLRLPFVYGPHDYQRREEPILRRVRAGRDSIPVGAANLLWTRGHVDDMATGVLAALDTRAADGQAVNLGEATTVPIGVWFEQILRASGSRTRLERVPDDRLPPDLALAGAPAQHLLVSSARAERLLGWAPGDPETRVAESVRWHLAHPPEGGWTDADAAADDAALAGP